MAADDLVDDWALAPLSATTTKRMVTPDISGHLCWSVIVLLQIETCLSFKRHLFIGLLPSPMAFLSKWKAPAKETGAKLAISLSSVGSVYIQTEC